MTVALPIAGQVFEATPQTPYLGLRLGVDLGQINALLTEAGLPETPGRDIDSGARRRGDFRSAASTGRGALTGCDLQGLAEAVR